MPAPAPTRSSGSAMLSFGPLTIPVQLFTSVEDTSTRFIKRSEYTRKGEPVGRAPIIKGTEPPELVDKEQVARCVETEHGLVELTDQEIKDVLDLPEKQAEIKTFLPLHVMGAGRYMPETLMQVRPAKGKQRGTFDPAAAKAFSTLLRAMRQEQVFALIELNLRGHPAYGALLPTGRLYRLLFDDEVREDVTFPDIEVSSDDVNMIRQMMEVSAKPPELTNEYRPLLLAYVQRKAEDSDLLQEHSEPDEEQVDDLLGKLRKSMEQE